MSENTRKRAKVFAIVIAALLALLLLIAFLIDGGLGKLFHKNETPKNHDVFLYEPDYDEDIFENTEYMSLDRFITYTDGAVTVRAVDDDDLKSAGKYAVFFGEYFDAVINGDAEKYVSFFTEKYNDKNGRKSKFTMQKIYGIDIRKLSETEDGELRTAVFEVRYAIFENNGTFRDDVASDTVRPQIYEIIYDLSNDEILINSVSEYKHK